MSTAVIDVTEATFQAEVLDRSDQVPVVVDFWAAWCGPCRILGPMLERLAGEADGAWVLAKVDVDSNQMLAARFGVQGIPAVHAFRGGREVDRFVGALPEPQVRMFLDRLGPTAADGLVAEAVAAESRGDLQAAAAAYAAALTHEPARIDAQQGRARCELALRATTLDVATVRDADPADVDAAIAFADLAAARGDLDDAFARLVESVRVTQSEARERARTHLLELLALVPADDPRALHARRALANALY